MTNAQLQAKLEKKGYKITADIGYKNDEQTIVSYSLKNDRNHTIKRETSLTKLLRNN
jgi:hypothetical protein